MDANDETKTVPVTVCQVKWTPNPSCPNDEGELVAILGVLRRFGFRLHPPTSMGPPNGGSLIYLCEHTSAGIRRENLEKAINAARGDAAKARGQSYSWTVKYTLG